VNQGIRNGQACLDDNAVNDFFGATVVQRVQSIAPAREVATQKLGLAPYGVFLVLDMKVLQKDFALYYQPIYSFCILHEMHETFIMREARSLPCDAGHTER
jgi:hypothetical protein